MKYESQLTARRASTRPDAKATRLIAPVTSAPSIRKNFFITIYDTRYFIMIYEFFADILFTNIDDLIFAFVSSERFFTTFNKLCFY
jgi:hypothetical protein